MATLFEKMWNGEVPCLPILKSKNLGTMAILANPQETRGQAVLFPERPVETVQEWTFEEAENVLIAGRAITKHMKAVLGVGRVVEHIEGWGVPNHAHTVLVPSYERGDSDRIHHPSDRMDAEVFAAEFSELQQLLTVPDEAIKRELLARQTYLEGLIAETT